jgi:CRISPR/Cas system CSM-associated protein Csm3 (group 7 of RAMP superfamily)
MRLRIDYTITAASGILVGSTSETPGIGIDRTTIRRRLFGVAAPLEPVIPGSTVKGKIRDHCERIVLTLGGQVCLAPSAETMCPHNKTRVKNPPCAICKVFGGPSNKSQLFFSDAVADISQFDPRFATRAQAGVSLSRKRRTAEDERLFHLERAIEGLTYRGSISGYLAGEASPQIALVIASFERLVAIGGSKSRGAGWTIANVTKTSLDDVELSEEQLEEIRSKGLKAWIESE